MLNQDYDAYSKLGILIKDIPDYIEDNLNPAFKLRDYQREAIVRLIHYLEDNPTRIKPSQLLFHMATGSGKTLLMAAHILYLFSKGYRNFLFFVNSTNIIEKTKDNFLNPNSSKYLFNEKIIFEYNEVKINEVNNFQTSNYNEINIIFTTIQGLYNSISIPRENNFTYEDLQDTKIALISDEAHHINAWTKIKRLTILEETAKNTWEYTVNEIVNSNFDNIMLEYTATIDLDNTSIYEKYKNKRINDYSLVKFREDGYSKEIKVLQADLNNMDRMLQAMILSQYRRKIAEKNKIRLKPVVLFKSKTIKASVENYVIFYEKIMDLTVKDITKIRSTAKGNILEKAFDYFKKEKITFENLVTELKEDFSVEKCMLLDSKNISERKQLRLNSLEDENNEIRAIFVVNMLNEGWDVLNLFDIVRLYDTRDSKSNIPGRTTMAEAQLIGRGARYFPFNLTEEDDKFKRKLDQEPDNAMKIVEELYYHSAHNPRYIQELKTALMKIGIMPSHEPRDIHLKIKENIKKTDFWKNNFIFVNRKVPVDRGNIKDIYDIGASYNFGLHNLSSGFIYDRAIFDEEMKPENDKTTRQFELKNFNESIIMKAISKIDFYRFNNLRKYFPKLETIKDFVEELKRMTVDIRSSNQRLSNITPDDKLEVCLNILTKLESQIINEYTEYKGTKIFIQNKIKDVVIDKILRINVDREYGKPMSDPLNQNLRLNLADKDWYVYDENYGTGEEKHFIQFLSGIMEKMEKQYSEIYLIRNANLFKIYRFSDGKAMEPDFVLFLKEKGMQQFIQYQLFVESKGPQLVLMDKWKEEFLEEIENNYTLQILAENENYKIIGMPFYTEETKNIFINIFKEKLGLN